MRDERGAEMPIENGFIRRMVTFDESQNVVAVDHRLYMDQEVYRAEMEKIFCGRSWVFLGLELEVQNPGDFITTYIGQVPVILARDDEGKLRAFENVCTHRGAKVEARPEGRAKFFRCLYHLWTYDLKGDLIGVPRQDKYGEGFRKQDYKLPQVSRVEAFSGLIFASYDADIVPVAEYLGELGPYIRGALRGGDLELLGYHRNRINANWKLFVENTIDAYHAENLHSRVIGRILPDSVSYGFNNGHGMTRRLETPQKEEELRRLATPLGQLVMCVFPNLLVLGGSNRPIVVVRQVIPKGPSALELVMRYLVPKGESDEMKRHAAAQTATMFGPAGFVNADDVTAMEAVQKAAPARYSRTILMRGLGFESGSPESASCEHALRSFYKMWASLMR